ncbi:hypothetical protein NHX12_028822 [Muraenolepis orangiensis]|uniref:polynucleotide adenylyltransferase n=1 Tax=Muraenolepis orangiensis TaxID=630683 RepID=A0A9Q0EE12_9TELE|nr:hypothetical protein NHX12_028822 [Muraenolepis orangiensis]
MREKEEEEEEEKDEEDEDEEDEDEEGEDEGDGWDSRKRRSSERKLRWRCEISDLLRCVDAGASGGIRRQLFHPLLTVKSIIHAAHDEGFGHSVLNWERANGLEPPSKDKRQALRDQVDWVKNIMTANIDRILARGERLEGLMGKSVDLQPGLSKQMLKLFEACQQQASDLTKKEMCRARLQRDIQSIFPVARLYLTGSSMSGLGCRSSDADLCLVLRGSTQRSPDPIHILTVLQAFLRPLGYLERIQLIRAKVPILRFKEKGSGLEFDLNVNNIVGIRNTFLLRSYANADLRVKPVIMAVKKWARYHEINDASKGTLSSYSLVLMVLHYLQTLGEPVLPSLQKDFPECFNASMDIDMVPEGPRHIPPYKSANRSSLGDLLQGFLKYYSSKFSWDNQVISVREAKALPKNKSGEWRNKYICLEEPFERNNVARAVHEQHKFNDIKSKFAASCQILTQSKDLNSLLPVKDTINKESSRK